MAGRRCLHRVAEKTSERARTRRGDSIERSNSSWETPTHTPAPKPRPNPYQDRRSARLLRPAASDRRLSSASSPRQAVRGERHLITRRALATRRKGQQCERPDHQLPVSSHHDTVRAWVRPYPPRTGGSTYMARSFTQSTNQRITHRYYIPADGDDAQHPNIFHLPPSGQSQQRAPTLWDVRRVRKPFVRPSMGSGADPARSLLRRVAGVPLHCAPLSSSHDASIPPPARRRTYTHTALPHPRGLPLPLQDAPRRGQGGGRGLDGRDGG